MLALPASVIHFKSSISVREHLPSISLHTFYYAKIDMDFTTLTSFKHTIQCHEVQIQSQCCATINTIYIVLKIFTVRRLSTHTKGNMNKPGTSPNSWASAQETTGGWNRSQDSPSCGPGTSIQVLASGLTMSCWSQDPASWGSYLHHHLRE